MEMTTREMAKYLKESIPSGTLDGQKLNPMLKSIAGENTIWNGVLAFKEFLTSLYDRLIADGGLYEKPPKKPKDNDSGHGTAVSLHKRLLSPPVCAPTFAFTTKVTATRTPMSC